MEEVQPLEILLADTIKAWWLGQMARETFLVPEEQQSKETIPLFVFVEKTISTNMWKVPLPIRYTQLRMKRLVSMPTPHYKEEANRALQEDRTCHVKHQTKEIDCNSCYSVIKKRKFSESSSVSNSNVSKLRLRKWWNVRRKWGLENTMNNWRRNLLSISKSNSRSSNPRCN